MPSLGYYTDLSNRLHDSDNIEELRIDRMGARWLNAALAIYVALAAIEIVRVVAFERPVNFDVGFYDWEEAPGTEEDPGPLAFRWTSGRAGLLRQAPEAVVTLPFYAPRPDLGAGDVVLAIGANGILLDERRVDRGGWTQLLYYLPPVSGTEQLAPLRTGVSSWNELRPWHRRRPAPVWLEVAVSRTFIPRTLDGSADDRELGVGLGPLRWGDALPNQGIGFHAWETDADVLRFRWTSRLWANQPVEIGGSEAAVRIRANHPDLAASAVSVEIFWNDLLRQTTEIRDSQWQTVTFYTPDLGPEPGVLTFHVDRTWNPAEEGISADTRRLGIAVSEIEWR